MPLLPKNPKIIHQETVGNKTVIVLKDGTYLNDVTKVLPAGIVNKSETGIGATSCELDAPRCSIIVEPVKSTASSKAGKSGSYYFGSVTEGHPDKHSKEKIEAILKDTTTPHKKFIVVADSLGKLKYWMGDAEFSKYFLAIDECDRLQLDVNFRKTMENIMNIYKNHPKNLRCLVSATPIQYNDPDLKGEEYTEFRYENPRKRDIKILETSNPLATAAEEILERNKKTPTEKVVVAYNNVSGLYNMAEKLVELGIPAKEISIMCGKSSIAKAGKYLKGLKDDKLPTKYVFKTSAYYTGYDLVEKYHLYTVVDSSDFLNTLSDDEVKQIAGRARKGLLSENILFKMAKDPTVHKPISLEELEDAADAQLSLLNCIESTLGSNTLLKETMKEVKELMGDLKLIYGYSLIKGVAGKYVKSYLSIDAILHINKINLSLFNHKDGFYNELKKKGHTVTRHKMFPKLTVEDTGIAKEVNREEMKHAMDMIKGMFLIFTESVGTHTIGRKISDIDIRNATKRQQLFYQVYNDLREVLDNTYLLEMLEEFSTMTTTQQLRAFHFSAKFAAIADNATAKKILNTRLEKGVEYSKRDLIKRFKEALTELKVDDVDEIPEKQLMTRLKQMVGVERRGKLKDKYLITGDTLYSKYLIGTSQEYLTDAETFRRMIRNNTALF